jgi:hypothetical protein|tara:strand:- start:788 stop:1018 length:231 start_codon:yes stop_codon:yes gene_type:complete
MSLMMFNKVKRSMRSVIELVKLNSNWKKEKPSKYSDMLESMESNMTVNNLVKRNVSNPAKNSHKSITHHANEVLTT